MLSPVVKVSVRHVHLCRAHIDVLFGPGYQLTNRRWLSESKAEFAAEERVILEGPKGRMERVGIIGPERSYTQVELSVSDMRLMGVDAPIRLSGDLKDTPGIRIIGPAGTVELESGVIAAHRHLHISMADAQQYHIRQHQAVSVRVDTPVRRLIFENVICCITMIPTLNTPAMMHIDTDEANAAGITGTLYGEVRL